MQYDIGLFGDRTPRQTSQRTCLTCRFFRYVELTQWCGHPKNNRAIGSPSRGCTAWIDVEQKGGLPRRVDFESSLKRHQWYLKQKM